MNGERSNGRGKVMSKADLSCWPDYRALGRVCSDVDQCSLRKGGKAMMVYWKAWDSGYSVSVVDNSGSVIAEYSAGNSRRDSQQTVPVGSPLAELPETLRCYAQSTAKDMALEYDAGGIEEEEE